MRMQCCYHVWPGAVQRDACDRIVALGEALAGATAQGPDGSWIPRAAEHAWLFRPLALLVDRSNTGSTGPGPLPAGRSTSGRSLIRPTTRAGPA